MNKKSVALTKEEYVEAVRLLREGFNLNGVSHKPNHQIATIVVLEATLGLRVGDILKLKLDSFVRDGNRYRLNIREEKTNKTRSFTVPNTVYTFIQDYAIGIGASRDRKLFTITERQVDRYLLFVFEAMGLDTKNYSSHAFRKLFAMSVYVNNNFNIELVRVLLQHSSIEITKRYLNVGTKEIESALLLTAQNII